MRLHCSALWLALAVAPAYAADVQLVGVFGDKAAVLSVDGSEPKTVKVGQKFEGVTLLAVERDQATIEVEGKRRVIRRGEQFRTTPKGDGAQSVVLAADRSGHYLVEGAVNGGAMRFLLDTGATAVSLPARDAERLGIDYRKGQVGMTQTANGPARAYRVKLDTVRVGGIELQNVDAIVLERGLEVGLLGMSFLNRVDMRRDGTTMTLTRRF